MGIEGYAPYNYQQQDFGEPAKQIQDHQDGFLANTKAIEINNTISSGNTKPYIADMAPQFIDPIKPFSPTSLVALPSFFGGSGQYQEYSDGYWHNIEVFVPAAQTITNANHAFTIYEVHKFVNGGNTLGTLQANVAFSGHDQLGNPFDITIPFCVQHGYLQPNGTSCTTPSMSSTNQHEQHA